MRTNNFVKDSVVDDQATRERMLKTAWKLCLERFARKTRSWIDMPQRKTQARPMRLEDQPQSFASNYWERLQQKLDLVLSGAPYYWQKDPNSHQLMLFCRTLDLLRQQCELEGLEP